VLIIFCIDIALIQETQIALWPWAMGTVVRARCTSVIKLHGILASLYLCLVKLTAIKYCP
jgi:hypothetical protein